MTLSMIYPLCGLHFTVSEIELWSHAVLRAASYSAVLCMAFLMHSTVLHVVLRYFTGQPRFSGTLKFSISRAFAPELRDLLLPSAI